MATDNQKRKEQTLTKDNKGIHFKIKRDQVELYSRTAAIMQHKVSIHTGVKWKHSIKYSYWRHTDKKVKKSSPDVQFHNSKFTLAALWNMQRPVRSVFLQHSKRDKSWSFFLQTPSAAAKSLLAPCPRLLAQCHQELGTSSTKCLHVSPHPLPPCFWMSPEQFLFIYYWLVGVQQLLVNIQVRDHRFIQTVRERTPEVPLWLSYHN